MAIITIEIDTADEDTVFRTAHAIDTILGLTTDQALVRYTTSINPIRSDLINAVIDNRLDDARDYLAELISDHLSDTEVIVTQWDRRDEISGYLWRGRIYDTEDAAVAAGGVLAD